MTNINNKAADFQKNIRIIAKTDELESKVNKINPGLNAAIKAALGEVRVTSTNDGSTSSNVSQGATSSASDTIGTGQDGNQVLGPPAPPPDLSKINNLITAATDALKASLNAANIKNSNTGSINSGDLSSKTGGNSPDSSTAGGTGSQFNDQALLGVNNSDWQTILAAMTARGASAEEIAAARRQFIAKELGVHDVGDVAKGNAGPKPSPDYIPSDSTSQPPLNEQLNAVIGTVVGSATQALLIRFDPNIIRPTNADAAAQGQNPWPEDGTQPADKSWQSGYYWVLPTGLAPHGAVYASTFSSLIAQRASLDNTQAYAFSGLVITKTNPSFGDDIQFGAPGHHVNDSTGSVGGTQYAYDGTGAGGPGKYTQHVCDGVDPWAATVCAASPPLQSNWPKTGVSTLQLIDGKFTYSPFDSEIPVELKGPQSSVRIASQTTDQNYEIRPSINGGFLIQDTLGADGYFLYYNADRTLKGPIPNEYIGFYTPRPQ